MLMSLELKGLYATIGIRPSLRQSEGDDYMPIEQHQSCQIVAEQHI